MLQKLRSRHPVDIPADGFGVKKGILAVLGGIFVLFVLLPLLLALLAGLIEPVLVLGIAIAVGTLLLILVLGAIIGKPGHAR